MSMKYAPAGKPVPSLIGKHISHAAQLLAHQHLNLRIIECKTDDQLPDGTIMSQSPTASTSIKPNQSVYCVLSQRPAKPKAPLFIGTTKQAALTQLQSLGIKSRIYYQQSLYPTDTCIAQYPAAQNVLEEMHMTLYIAHNTKPIIVPNFKDVSVEDVKAFLEPHQINVQIISDSLSLDSYHLNRAKVVDQRPLSGTILSPEALKNLTFQVSVST